MCFHERVLSMDSSDLVFVCVLAGTFFALNDEGHVDLIILQRGPYSGSPAPPLPQTRIPRTCFSILRHCLLNSCDLCVAAPACLLVSERADAESRQHSVAIKNDNSEDAYFLTTLGLNGLCPAWCPAGAKFPSPKVHTFRGWLSMVHVVKKMILYFALRRQSPIVCQVRLPFVSISDLCPSLCSLTV
jgi:hypothetical protein